MPAGPASGGSAVSGNSTKYTSHPHDAILFGVGFSLDEGMTVDALAPGCSADRSGSVQIGDYVAGVDGQTELSPTEAKELILGRQGTYTTINFRRPEGVNVRTFKVQLMRGSADYIFLVECLRGLEHQIADLQAENQELKNSVPSQRPASDGLRGQIADLQAENDWLREKHRAEIGELLTRIEDIENRERMQPVARSTAASGMSSPQASVQKQEGRRAQRSAPAPPRASSPPRSQPRFAAPAPPASGRKGSREVEIEDDVPLVQMTSGGMEAFHDGDVIVVDRLTPKRAQRSAGPPAKQPNLLPTPIKSPYAEQGSSPSRVPYAASVPRPRGPSIASPYMGPVRMDPYYPSPPVAMGGFMREPIRETLIAHPFQVFFAVSLDLLSAATQIPPAIHSVLVAGKRCQTRGAIREGPRFGNDVRGDLA